VPCSFEQHGQVVGEHGLPAPSLGCAEGDVLGGPDQQGAAVGELRKACLDLGEELPARENLSGNTYIGRRDSRVGKGPR
jgi:hypothetical protein